MNHPRALAYCLSMIFSENASHSSGSCFNDSIPTFASRCRKDVLQMLESRTASKRHDLVELWIAFARRASG
jgi:hypothetical protein